MPRLALRIEPGAAPPELHRLAGAWEQLLDRSERPVTPVRSVLPDLVAVNLLTGIFRNGAQPAVSPEGNVFLWMDGELWDRSAAAGEETESDPELCLRLFLRHGDRFCEQLNGQFIIAIYDTVRRRLLVCNDRYAFRPLFWHTDSTSFTCATEVKSVLAATGRAETDPQGALELFAYGYQMGDRTLFRNVHALLPGSRLSYERGRVRVERYWRFRYPEQSSRAGEAELVDELAERIKTACARQSGGPGRVGMALSAGLDSRMVAAGLGRERRPGFAYTTGYENSLDALGARQLADAYGIPHLHLIPHEGYMSAVGPEVVWRSEGCFSFTNATAIQFHPQLRPELDIILTGHAGGALSGQTLLPRFLAGNLRSIAPADLGEYLFGKSLALPEEEMRELFVPETWDAVWPCSRAGFRATVEELGDQCRRKEDAAIAWNVENRQARFTHHSGQVDRYDFEVRAPLLDNDVVDFFLTVPYQYRFAQRLYKRTLAERFPEAARVPWSKTGRAVPGQPLEILAEFYLGGVSRQLSRRIPFLARRQKDRTRTCRVVADEMRRDTALRTEILDPFLRGDGFPDGILHRDAARRRVEAHWAGTESHPHFIGCLVTLALASRQFVECGLQAPPRPVSDPVLEAA